MPGSTLVPPTKRNALPRWAAAGCTAAALASAVALLVLTLLVMVADRGRLMLPWPLLVLPLLAWMGVWRARRGAAWALLGVACLGSLLALVMAANAPHHPDAAPYFAAIFAAFVVTVGAAAVGGWALIRSPLGPRTRLASPAAPAQMSAATPPAATVAQPCLATMSGAIWVNTFAGFVFSPDDEAAMLVRGAALFLTAVVVWLILSGAKRLRDGKDGAVGRLKRGVALGMVAAAGVSACALAWPDLEGARWPALLLAPGAVLAVVAGFKALRQMEPPSGT